MPFTLTGAQVRTLRQAVGVSQAELARALGYTRYAVCQWERRAERSIPRTQYRAVLLALGRFQDASRDDAALLSRLPAVTS